MTRTFELIKDVVENLDLTIKVKNVDGLRLFVCETLYLRPGDMIEDGDGNTFQILTLKNNDNMLVNPSVDGQDFIGDTIYLRHFPYFLQGKWMSANDEYLRLDTDTSEKTPLIWLVRGYEEEFFDKSSSVKMEVSPVIYFLDQANFDSWLTEDHDKEAINPMYNLAIRFIKEIKKDGRFKVDSYKIKDEPKFGVEITPSKGNKKRILSDDLSGVGLRITPLKFLGNCINC